MSLFATKRPPVYSEARARCERLQAALDGYQKRDAAIEAEIETARRDLREAIEEGGNQAEAAAALKKLAADRAEVREMAEATRDVLAKAEAARAELREAERRRLLEVALRETERELLVARDAVGPAAVSLFEARGREQELAERLSALRRQFRTLTGGQVPDAVDPVSSSAQIATAAVTAKHGAGKVRHLAADAGAFSMAVFGLAGPEPRTDPED